MLSLVACSLTILSAALPGESHYLEGAAAERAGRWGDALKAYEAAYEADPILRPFAAIRRAWSMRNTNGEAAVASLRGIAEKYGQGPWTHMADGYLARVLGEQNRHRDAVPHYAKVLDEKPLLWWLDSWYTEAANNKLATRDMLLDGYGLLAKYVIETGAVRPRLEASRMLANSPNPDHRAAAVRGMLRSSAVTEAAGVALSAPSSLTLPDNTILALTEMLPNAVAASEAEGPSKLETVLEKYPDEPWLISWLAWAVRGEARSGNNAGALLAAELLVRHYPDTRDTGDALWWLSSHLKDRDPETAVLLWQRLADSCPSHFRADNSLHSIAEHHRAQGRHQAELAAYEQLAERFPGSPLVPESFYKLALRESRAGNEERAKAFLYRAAENGMGNFYSHRALERLHQAGASSQASSRNLRVAGGESFVRPYQLDGSVRNIPALPEAWAESSALKRIRFFAKHGLEESEWEALFLLDKMGDNSEVEPHYRSLAEAGLAHSALQTAAAREWGAFPKGEKSAARWRLEFPRAYWPLFLAISQETGVDPYLMMALAKQESTFRPNLTSHAGASGVMQLMPATANWMADVDPNISRSHVGNLESPINSIRLGAYYLKRMLDRSGGNIIYALASYNAGPGNCDRWRKRWPNASPEEFMDNIPFRETNDYVRKVLGNYAAYHSLYPAIDWNSMTMSEALAAWR